MIRGFANVLFPTYPQTSDGQEPHGQDSPGHYIHIRFVFELIGNYIYIIGAFFFELIM